MIDENLLKTLVCPVSRGKLVLSDDRTELLSPTAGLAYPIINNVPVLLPARAREYQKSGA